MAPKPPRSRVITAMTDVFAKHGYEGASLSALGAAGGLSKAGLYHHFPGGKAEMAGQVLATSGRQFTKLILEPMRSKEPAAERLHLMLDGLEHYYRGGTINCLMNTLALGDGLTLFGSSIQTAITAWLELLIPMLKELGDGTPDKTARHMIAAIHGALIQARLFEDPSIFKTIVDDIRKTYR